MFMVILSVSYRKDEQIKVNNFVAGYEFDFQLY
jgi:hypothetical protein